MEEVHNQFLNLMRGIESERERNTFLKWIHTNWDLDNLEEDDEVSNSPKSILNAIAEEIRPMVPFASILPSENINVPICGPNSDCEADTTLHVDEFLYDDDHINDLVDKEQLSRYYCGKCFSRDIKLLTFISHSMSIERIHFIFQYLLHPLRNETILDVGSRLGPVLYGAYMYTTCPKIIGVEINPEFCNIQSKIIKKYKFDDRIKIICNDICNELDVVSKVDVIILNNVFEFFSDYKTAVTSWHLLAENIKPGCILVTTPHLKNTFKYFKVDFNWQEWVEELEPHRLDLISDNDDWERNVKNIKHYRVVKVFTELKNVK